VVEATEDFSKTSKVLRKNKNLQGLEMFTKDYNPLQIEYMK
jgi:hypothetical protein